MTRLANPAAVARFADDNVAHFPNGGGGDLKKCTITVINNSTQNLGWFESHADNGIIILGAHGGTEAIAPNEEKTFTASYFCETETGEEPKYYVNAFIKSLGDDVMLSWSNLVNVTYDDPNLVPVDTEDNSSATVTATD